MNQVFKPSTDNDGHTNEITSINNKGILDRGPIILITRQANNQSLNSAQNQGDQESSIRQQRLLRPVSPSTKLLTQGGATTQSIFNWPRSGKHEVIN